MKYIFTTAKVSLIAFVCGAMLLLAPIAGVELGMMVSQWTGR